MKRRAFIAALGGALLIDLERPTCSRDCELCGAQEEDAFGVERWRKKRTISRLASGPRGSVYDPAALPPDHA
jgi:hypothetical protein